MEKWVHMLPKGEVDPAAHRSKANKQASPLPESELRGGATGQGLTDTVLGSDTVRGPSLSSGVLDFCPGR